MKTFSAFLVDREVIQSVGMGSVDVNQNTKSDCNPHAKPPTIRIFQPVLPTTSFLTLKQIPTMAEVSSRLAKLIPRNSPVPVAIGEASHPGVGKRVLHNITRKNARMKRGNEAITCLYRVSTLAFETSCFANFVARIKMTGAKSPILIDLTHKPASSARCPPP
jgi:hypothetical protein